MRGTLYIIISLIVSVSCSVDNTECIPEPDMSPEHVESYQTTLMYFMGRSLASGFRGNIDDAADAVADGALGSNGSLFYLMPQSSTSAILYEMVKIGEVCSHVERVRYDTDFASGTTEAIELVFSDLKSIINYPEGGDGRKLNLIFGGHGSGWVLKSSSSTALVLRSAGDSGVGYESYEDMNDRILSRYFGSSYDGELDISEFCGAIEASGVSLGYILLDQCYNSSIEMLYRMRNLCDYIVASVSEVMWTGFPYDTVIPELFEGDGATYDLQGACEAFREYYDDPNLSYPCGTVAVCVTDELEMLARVVSRMDLTPTTNEVSYYDHYDSRPLFYDFGEMIAASCDNSDQLEWFNMQFDQTFPPACRLHSGYYFNDYGNRVTPVGSGYSGVSTSELSTNSLAAGWEREPWAVDARGESN